MNYTYLTLQILKARARKMKRLTAWDIILLNLNVRIENAAPVESTDLDSQTAELSLK
jgi:hypothetical protein